MANILMRPATAGAQAARSENIPLQPEHASQIVCAGLLGNGVARLEEAVRLRVPFMLEKQEKWQSPELMPQRHQLNEKLMGEAAEKILIRAYERAGMVIPDRITIQFKALSVVEHLKQQILKEGLHVYSQKLLFDASLPLDQRMALLEGMKIEKFEPRRATVAIATGRLPHLPAYSVPELVRSLDSSWRGVTFQLSKGIVEWIGTNTPWLIEFPLPDLKAGAVARTDHFDSSDYRESAALGLGFFLLSFDKKYNQFYVVTPTLAASRNKKDATSQPVFLKHYHYTSHTSLTAIYRELADLVRVPSRAKLARLEVCAKCGAIFSSDRADLSHASC